MDAIEIPGAPSLHLDHLVVDVNGTLTDRGDLIEGVADRLVALARSYEVHLLSSDTFGTLDALAARFGVDATRVGTGEEKVAFVEALGADRCAAVGNGANDRGMLGLVALGIVVVGPEGAAASTLAAADVVCGDIGGALDLLADPRALASTLRR